MVNSPEQSRRCKAEVYFVAKAEQYVNVFRLRSWPPCMSRKALRYTPDEDHVRTCLSDVRCRSESSKAQGDRWERVSNSEFDSRLRRQTSTVNAGLMCNRGMLTRHALAAKIKVESRRPRYGI
jgi:hypothetical protein